MGKPAEKTSRSCRQSPPHHPPVGTIAVRAGDSMPRVPENATRTGDQRRPRQAGTLLSRPAVSHQQPTCPPATHRRAAMANQGPLGTAVMWASDGVVVSQPASPPAWRVARPARFPPPAERPHRAAGEGVGEPVPRRGVRIATRRRTGHQSRHRRKPRWVEMTASPTKLKAAHQGGNVRPPRAVAKPQTAPPDCWPEQHHSPPPTTRKQAHRRTPVERQRA